MSDAMHGIEEDVQWSEATCASLVSFCNTTASTIDSDAGTRASAVTTGSTDFEGHFSQLFKDNASTAKSDSTELANRLREIATWAGELEAQAKAEQARRVKAREWKKEQDDRNAWERGWDSVFGGDDPPVGPPDPPLTKTSSASLKGDRQTPTTGSGGGGGGGTSSARPDKLRSFASTSRGLNTAMSGKPGSLETRLSEFAANCKWGTLDGSSVVTGFKQWNTANDNDVQWADTIAAAFEKAGGEGPISTLPNSALANALKAKGIDATRDDITIDPAIAVGNPPTTGYANDPVNTATGNFLENEADLVFGPGASDLMLTRTYNSFVRDAGAFGPGWSSWTEVALSFDDEAARMTMPDGRVVVFPRLDDGWARATGENLWLTRAEDGFAARDNDGRTWSFDAAGRLVATERGLGTRVAFTWTDGRLTRLTHVRARAVDLVWDADRIVRAEASDGRAVDYAYDDAGRLLSATGAEGTRSYTWGEDGLIESVTDADGVVEVTNVYDEHGRVTRQRSQFGRVTRFVYLDGHTTVVSDLDGERSNTWIHDKRGRLVGIVDADEQRQSTAYDTDGNPVMFTDRNGDVTVHEYDARGRRVRTVTPSGADLTFGYDELDRVTTVVTESGAVSEYEYSADLRNPSLLRDPEGGETHFEWTAGLLTSVTDPTGVVVRFEHDVHGDLVATIDADGNAARLERDAVGRVVAAITPSGARTAYSYDAHGHLATRRDPDGAVWRYEHTTAGRLAAIVDPTGARTTIERGDHGEEERTIDPLGRAITRHLDDLGNLASSTLPDGSTWRFTHDALSRLTETVDPTGGSWRHEYDLNGQLTATIDPTGVRRTVSGSESADGTEVTIHDGDAALTTRFDALGRHTSTENADGSAAMATYDRCGRPVELLDVEGGLTRVERDAAGRPIAVTSPTGLTTRQEWDHCGRLVATVDPSGARTTRSYDADGRLVRVEGPTGEVAWWEHDVNGRVTAAHRPGRGTARYVHDRAGRVVQSSDPWTGRRKARYDEAGQLVAVTNGVGGVTRYEYDENGRAVAITDPLGRTTTREFDAMNRCVAETDPLGRTLRAGYDAAGRIVWQTDAEGHRTEWTYDESGRQKALLVDGEVQSSVTRDLRRRTVAITDHTGTAPMTHELEWNRRGQLVRRTRDGESVTWDYDAEGRRTAVHTPDGHTTTYAYDASGLLASVEHPLLGRASFGRDAAGRVVEAAAGGTIQTWEHADGFVVGHTVTDAEGASRTRIVRDESGRVEAVDRDDVVTRYGYDEACQLVEATLDGMAHTWTYDEAGQLVAESVDGAVTTYRYDAAAQLVAVKHPSQASTLHEYDALGRRVRTDHADGRIREFGWSATGYLASVTDHAGDQVRRTSTHVDALGELASVDGHNVWWDTATHAGTPLLAGGESVVAAGAFTGVGDQWSAAGWRTTRAADSADPWAVPSGVDLPGGLAIGDTGELLVGGADPLEWMGQRVYDAGAHGFLSVDPLDPVPGAGWSGNPYSYAGNDPLHALDPLGLRPVTEAELQAYRDSNNGAMGAVGDWVKNNWEYLAGGAMVIAGGVLMATGVGGPAGMMLISAGADTIIQKATTGEVNWGQVAVAGAAGGIGFGAGSLVARGGGSAMRVAMTEGVTEGLVSGGGSYLTGPGPHTPAGFVRSTAFGGATGALPFPGGAGGAGDDVLESAGRRAADRAPLPLRPDDSPVVFKAPPNATPDEIAQVRAYVDGCNQALCDGALSPTGRVSTAGELRRQASAAAAAERAANPGAYGPGQHVGHVPDTTWTGTAQPHSWQALDARVNTSLGGQAAHYPVGYQPTSFHYAGDYGGAP